MDMQTPQTVTLPDGTCVQSPATKKLWWTEQDGHGYVDPSLIAPDPTQPRSYIDPLHLTELQLSIAESGVRQNLTVTPRSFTPWIHLPPGYEKAFFIVVSGHRRRDAAIAVGLPAVPVTVKIYPNQQEHMFDRSVLNMGREELSELEQGREYLVLNQSGIKIVDIAKRFGLHSVQIINRIHLTRLHPDIQLLIGPERPKKSRLPIVVAELLGSLKAPTQEELQTFQDSFEEIIRPTYQYVSDISSMGEDERRLSFQKMLVAVISRTGMKGTRSVEFIREQSLAHSFNRGANSSFERYAPRKRRQIFENLYRSFLESVPVYWKIEEFERIYYNLTREEVEQVLGMMKAAEDCLKSFRGIMENIRDKKHPALP